MVVRLATRSLSASNLHARSSLTTLLSSSQTKRQASRSVKNGFNCSCTANPFNITYSWSLKTNTKVYEVVNNNDQVVLIKSISNCNISRYSFMVWHYNVYVNRRLGLILHHFSLCYLLKIRPSLIISIDEQRVPQKISKAPLRAIQFALNTGQMNGF